MDDLTFSKPTKPVTCCWECGKEEGRNERFKQCRKCVEQKVIPAKFCSEHCFQSSWKRHKPWHNEQKRQLSPLSATYSLSQDALNALAERSKYDSQLALANTRINNAVDIAGASTILERAVNLDPSRPEAYFTLAVCSEASGHLKQAAFYYEQAIERWALAALTGITGGSVSEEERHLTWALQQWSTAIDFVTRLYMTRQFLDHPKPEWYRIDGLLQLVAKVALTASRTGKTEDSTKKKARLSLLQAFAASGMIRNGTFYQCTSLGYDTNKNNKSSADLLEAAGCFRSVIAAARADADMGFRSDDLHSYHAYARTCTNLAELKRREETSESEPMAKYSVGSWVAIRSKQQQRGSKVRFGQILATLNSVGKVAIKVQGEEGPLLVSPTARNLVSSTQTDQSNALVACLDKEAQWK